MMDEARIRDAYAGRYAALETIARDLEQHLRNTVTYPRIDRIAARAKTVDRFVAKALKEEGGTRKYAHPLEEIQDQVGARIVTFYLDDVDAIAAQVEGFFASIEEQQIVPDSVSKFGYEGRHFILIVPSDVIDPSFDTSELPDFFELQIKTLFQHAWGEAGHDLAYKPEAELSDHELRQIAFTAAQAWGADQIFSELARSIGGEAS